MFVYLFTLALFLIIFDVLLNYNRSARLMREIPGPKMAFIAGNTFDIMIPREKRFRFLRQCAKEWCTIWRVWGFNVGGICIYKPDDIEVLLSGMKHTKKNILYKFLRPWLQDGLLLSDGLKWQKRRKILTPAFHFNILRRFCTIFEENCQNLISVLEKKEGQPVNVVECISQYTLQTICETAMGTQISNEKTESGKSYKDAIYELGDLIVHRITHLYLYSDFIYFMTTARNMQKKCLNRIHKFTSKVINIRKSFIEAHGNTIDYVNEDEDDKYMNKKRKTAMLDLLISAEKQGQIFSNGIQEEVDTFMFEGHDTTASGLTYALMVLASNKHVQEKIVEELKEIFSNSKRNATIDDLSKMNYLERCIKECLRLYPPVPLIGRIMSEDVKLGGYLVPKGIHCLIHIYDLHRDAELYKDPLVFDPDRFLPENCINRHPYAYLPFSAGPRNCIGQKFALLEMKSVISGILRNFVLHPITKDEDLDLIADIVLRNSGPVYVKFVKRQDTF